MGRQKANNQTQYSFWDVFSNQTHFWHIIIINCIVSGGPLRRKQFSCQIIRRQKHSPRVNHLMRRREWWKQKKNQIQKIKTTTKAKNKTTTKAMLVMTTMLTSIAGNLPTTADIKVTLHYCSDHLCLWSSVIGLRLVDFFSEKNIVGPGVSRTF